ncbi:MAG: hypothetical protein WAV21_01190 [Minisyncoccia bacterium]
MYSLTKQEEKLFKRLSTPIKIQDFLDTIPMNFEKKGETHYSPRRVLEEKKAHCIEGALFAATALWVNGEEPIIMDLVAARPDDDHVIALYKKNGYWGAISKTNHASLRFRDPIYKTPRELALSYFHEWFINSDGTKTLQTYSKPFNLKKLGAAWITAEKDLWEIDQALGALPHYPLVPKGNARYVRKADTMELQAGRLTEWKESDSRT